MKKLVMVFGIVMLIGAGCAEKQAGIDKGPIVLHKEYMEPGTDTPYNGERIVHNEDLNLRAKAIYVDGYPEKVTYYNSNERKKTEIVVANNGKGDVVRHTEWYASGQKKFEHQGNTLNEWHENGQLKAEVSYDESGDLHGTSKIWDEDGNLKEKEVYEHGSLVAASE